MNFKRALLSGALLWVLIFFEVSILMFGFKLTGNSYYITHYILLIFLTTIATLVYFRGKKAKAGLKEGALLGLTFVIVGIILDAVITIPLFIKDYSFFLDIKLILSYLEGIIITSIIGYIRK